jgi:uracil-DNA glycosylase
VIALIDAARTLQLAGCHNPYCDEQADATLDGPSAAAIRRANLAVYLTQRGDAPLLLVGEAMGYRGGRFSGIAFTSERILAGWGAPYRASSRRVGGWAESSATIVHEALRELQLEREVVLWNTLALHPYRAGNPLTNRPPTMREIAQAGLGLLDLVIDHLRPQRIIAVGRVAEGALGARADAAVRHPSQGGAEAFRAGLRHLAG